MPDDVNEALNDDDLDSCEACGKSMPYGDGVVMCDCTFCKDCYAEWLADFNTCAHEWEPSHHPASGDPGRYCHKCSGFVADEEQTA